MNGLTYRKDYKNDENLRKSFNELAAMVFGINFEEWYQKGFWGNRYIPFSYIDEDKVVANVSVNVLDLVMDGKKKSALQIGTVMTHPDYRNRGLSAGLMNKVLEEYQNNYDFMYLMANPSVLNFYPKFGFERVDEYQYTMDYLPGHSDRAGIHKLNGKRTEDLDFIYQFAKERVPVSKTFGTENAQGILMFYCLYVFHHDIYYLEEEEVMVIYKKEEGQIDIFDMISKKEIPIEEVLTKISDVDTKKVVFHYTPDYKGIKTKRDLYNGDEVLFVRTGGDDHFPLHLKHPLTSQA
ncbi:GNAT family N-acetyltransferase [Neobacillus sp. Marseille-QA0830]